MKKLSLWLTVLLTGCVGIPENVKPVDNFNVHSYLGKWYDCLLYTSDAADE